MIVTSVLSTRTGNPSKCFKQKGIQYRELSTYAIVGKVGGAHLELLEWSLIPELTHQGSRSLWSHHGNGWVQTHTTECHVATASASCAQEAGRRAIMLLQKNLALPPWLARMKLPEEGEAASASFLPSQTHANTYKLKPNLHAKLRARHRNLRNSFQLCSLEVEQASP